MIELFNTHIEKTFPDLRKFKLLVACSGGVDSVLLSFLLKKLEFTIVISHCNFQLRGKDSDDDEHFVKQFGKQLDVDVITKSFSIKDIVDSSNSSVQMVARDIRYRWFKKLLKEQCLDFIVTAHHLDDALETFLININRGTGIEGLLGIPKKNNQIIRPFLPFSKQEILRTAKKHALSWQEDKSNFSKKYLRNQIRNNIVSSLKSLDSNFLKNFQTTIQHLEGTAQLLESYINALRKTIFLEKGVGIIQIEINPLKNFVPQDVYLFNLFKIYGFRSGQNIAKLIESQSGKVLMSKTHLMLKDRNVLLLKPLADKDLSKQYVIENFKTPKDCPLTLIFEEVSTTIEKNHKIAYLDKNLLRLPLTLRRWHKSDYFCPFGMNGKKKKLSKFFKDEKYSIFQKEKQWLLCSDKDITWIVGKRQDHRFRVKDDTETIIKVTLKL